MIEGDRIILIGSCKHTPIAEEVLEKYLLKEGIVIRGIERRGYPKPSARVEFVEDGHSMEIFPDEVEVVTRHVWEV